MAPWDIRHPNEEVGMPKYLLKVAYTAEGAAGLMKDGGSARVAVVEKLLGQMGGSLEAFYFALGDDDAFVICDVPSDTAGAAVSLRVAASGAVRVKSIALLTPAQLDEAAKMQIDYTPPGG
jgi:uncharacterized protein with GYD domain